MLGGRTDGNLEIERDQHFAAFAKRFALDAKMFRCRAAVHVENKDDIVFWSGILRHVSPDDRFHFIAASRNEYGNETSGVTQCLKYYKYLSDSFFICIDSDYRYLMRERGYDPEHFVLQTYTYSFENHHCYPIGLDDVCSRVTKFDNRIFDFAYFMKLYSNIIYPLFLWHLYFMAADSDAFGKNEFNEYLNLPGLKPKKVILNNAVKLLEEMQSKVDKKVNYLKNRYPDADMAMVADRYSELGLNKDTAYLFVRGHNVYDMMSLICREVCKNILLNERVHKSSSMINELYSNRGSVDTALKQNVMYGDYDAIRMLEKDVRKLLKLDANVENK